MHRVERQKSQEPSSRFTSFSNSLSYLSNEPIDIYTKRNARHTHTLKYQQSITLFRQLPHLLSIAAACNKQRRTHHFSEHIHYTFDSHLIAPTGDLYIYIPVDDDGMWSWTNAHAWTANNDEGMYMSLGCHIYPFWGVNKLSILFCRVVRWKQIWCVSLNGDNKEAKHLYDSESNTVFNDPTHSAVNQMQT